MSESKDTTSEFSLTPPPLSREEERRAKKNERNRQWMKRWYEQNLEEARKRGRDHRAKDPSKSVARAKKWAEENPCRVKENYQRYYAEKKEVYKERSRRQALENPDKIKAYGAARYQKYRGEALQAWRRRRYGLTQDDYEAMLRKQDWRCLICKIPMNSEIRHLQPNIDHCHSTGRVRGILCRNCNAGIGLFQDNPTFLRAAARYLERASKDESL